MIAVHCECGQKLKVNQEHAGKRAKCPKCGSKLLVPSVEGYLEEDDLSGLDENFDGVASLLDEALAPPPSSPTLASAPSTAASMRPMAKKRRAARGGLWETLSQHAVSILVLGLLAAITAGVVLGGLSMYRRYAFSQALGGGNDRDALKQVAANLPYAVQYANDVEELDNVMRRRLLMMSKVLYHLPDDVELSPLLEMRSNVIPYAAAFEVVKKRAKPDWLIEKSCDSREAVRQFAAKALRPTFPFGQLDDAGFAQLVEPTSVAEKQQRYQAIYAELHQPFEAKFAGNYQLAFDAVWQADATTREAKAAISAQPRLRISCRDYVWTVDFYGVKWTGKVDDLLKLALSCPTIKTDEDLVTLPHYQTLAPSQLKLAWQAEALVVSVDPLPKFVPSTSGRVSTRTGRGGGTVPQGATTKTITNYANGEKVSEQIEWTLPERPGYSKFEIRLVRAGA